MLGRHAVGGMLAVFLAWLATSPPATGQDAEALAKTAALACQANLDAFQFYKCQFTLTFGDAESAEKALRGEYRNVRRYEHILVVDGDKEKLEYVGAPFKQKHEKSEIKPIGNNLGGVAMDWLPFADLRDGENSFSYLSLMETADVRSEGGSSTISVAYLPLSMGAMGSVRCESSPWRLLQGGQGGLFSFLKCREQDLDKDPVVELAFAMKEPKKGQSWLERQLFLDVQRGYLPKQAILYLPGGAKVATHVFLKEAKECQGQRWFPMHTVVLRYTHNPLGIVDIRVTELEVDKRPDASDFTLKVPAGTVIRREGSKERQAFRLRQDEEINTADIPRLIQMLERSKQVPLMDTAVKKPGWGTTTWVLAGVGATLLLLGIGALMWWRLRARAA